MLYLLLGAAAWWHGWGSTWLAVGWGDPAQEVWYLAWLPHALANGLNPFVSHAMFAPNGINLVANTSILLPALVMSPVTALFGPLVAFDVAVVLAPALSALAGFAAFHRYAPYGPAAFIGGLLYGFSPFILHDLAFGHLHVTTMVFPPLMLLVLDDIAVRRRGSAAREGALLGLLVAGQFFTSLEVLAMTIILAAAGLLVLALRHRSEVAASARRLLVAFATAAPVAGVLVAYPTWVLLAGPRRYHGSVFPNAEGYVTWLKLLLWPLGGGVLPVDGNAYLGIPLIAVLAVACWRCRSGALRFAGTMAVIALVLSMGRSMHLTPRLGTGIPLPDALLARLPELENLLPIRFALFVAFFAAMGLAVTIDRIRTGELTLTAPRLKSTTGPVTEEARGVPVVIAGAAVDDPVGAAGIDAGTGTGSGPGSGRERVPTGRRGILAITIGVAAIASPALGVPLPYPVQHVPVPAVYRSDAITRLPKGSVLLTYPIPNGFHADQILWQAETGIPYDQVAGYGFIPGPGAHPLGSLPPGPVTNAFGLAQLELLPAEPPAGQVEAMRSQLAAWHVTDIVAQPVGDQMPRLVALLEAVTGRSPQEVDGAWVWTGL